MLDEGELNHPGRVHCFWPCLLGSIPICCWWNPSLKAGLIMSWMFKLLISHFLIFPGWNFGTFHFCWLIFCISMSPPKAPCWCPWCLWRAPWRQRRAARWPVPPRRRAHPLEIRRAEPKRWCCGVAGSRSCSTCQPLEKELLRMEGEDGG